jgi:hypothetical protein
MESCINPNHSAVGMGHPLIDKIVDEGVQSVNVSMLSPQLRLTLMSEAGSKLMHLGRYQEAGHAFSLANNKEALKEHGHWFLQQQRLAHAAYFLLHVEREEFLEDLAQKCIAANEIEAAKAIYNALGDQVMLHFIRENLG